MNKTTYALFRFYYAYKRIDHHIFYLILAAFSLHLINAVFMMILNLYMSKEGFEDFAIANYVSYRFLAVMVFAFPLGFLIKGRKLKPLFYTAGVLVPLSSLVLIEAISLGNESLMTISMIFWGIGFTCMQVSIMPFIIRNAKPSTRTEAIALNYATWSFSLLISGVIVSILLNAFPGIFNEKNILTFFTFCGFLSLYFIYNLDFKESIPSSENKRLELRGYNWGLIAKALTPTAIIAIGAGLTIPFINLFFFHVYDIDSDGFAIMGTATAVLVAIGAIGVPEIKRRFGYTYSITVSQSISVIALVILATTELFSNFQFAVVIAIACYIIRQPLMNMAAPMTSELTMLYVGKRNQEIISALTSTIWSGSWFISSQIFRILRGAELSYAMVFYITAALYAVGVILYYFLILDYRKRKKAGLIQN